MYNSSEVHSSDGSVTAATCADAYCLRLSAASGLGEQFAPEVAFARGSDPSTVMERLWPRRAASRSPVARNGFATPCTNWVTARGSGWIASDSLITCAAVFIEVQVHRHRASGVAPLDDLQ